MKTIILNVGYYNTKFKNSLGVYDTHETRVQENSVAIHNRILHKGIMYEVGKGNRNIVNRNQNFVHLLCTNYHILNSSENEDRVVLIVALPMSQYLNKALRQDYINSIKGQSPLISEINGVVKKVYIENVICYMEGASAILANQNVFRDRVCGIVDIGGNTINAAIFDNMNLLADTATTLDLGTIKAEKEIIDKLNILKGWNVQDYEVKQLLHKEDVVCKNTIQTICRQYVKSTKNKLLEKKWSLGSLPLFFTGGGTLFFNSYIQEEFSNLTISQDCIYDNLNGLAVVEQQLNEGC